MPVYRNFDKRIRVKCKIKCCEDSRETAGKLAFFEPPQHKNDRNMSLQMLRATFVELIGPGAQTGFDVAQAR
ncbi:MAG: hypothetical protein OXF88_00670, partial [Rhodobacteraceae bacterium]|nr:hypothetical protein [Paracoccaceae bacterium]